MTARPDLDIADLLSHYGVFIKGGSRVQHIRAPALDEVTSAYDVLGRVVSRVGWGPDLASSCTALAVQPGVVWDVNGWYRLLGVAPDATVGQMRVAFLSRTDPLHPDSRMLYILGQLRKPDVRRRYDCMPLGSQFLEDRWVQDELSRLAAREAARRNAASHGGTVTSDAVLDELGYERGPGGDGREEAMGDAERAQEPLPQEWAYSWYRREAGRSEAVLAAWQEALVRVLSGRGITAHFAVGASAGGLPCDASWHDGRAVFWIGQGADPDDLLAGSAVDLAAGGGLVAGPC
jgi:hypothetical protein